MSKWSSKRKGKILIAIGILIVLVILFAFIQYENSKVPTCFDGIQNGGESGIDCGGTCALQCKVESNNLVSDDREILISWEMPGPDDPYEYYLDISDLIDNDEYCENDIDAQYIYTLNDSQQWGVMA